jgi:hypothetical protein
VCKRWDTLVRWSATIDTSSAVTHTSTSGNRTLPARWTSRPVTHQKTTTYREITPTPISIYRFESLGVFVLFWAWLKLELGHRTDRVGYEFILHQINPFISLLFVLSANLPNNVFENHTRENLDIKRYLPVLLQFSE